MIDILEEEIGGEDKVLIFSRFANRVVPHIISTLKKYDKGGVVSITGKVPPAESNAIMQHFKDSNKARFLVCSDALAYGANLQVARHVINFDLPWNPARLDQRIARVYRRGQTKPVNVFNFIVPGTIEEHLYAMLAAKRGLAAKFLKQAKRTGGDINLKALAKLI
jgi:SNF2 family DNA or RNA helicase